MPSNFDELVNMLKSGGEDLPPTIYDDLHETYLHDVSTREAKIGEFDTERENYTAQLQEREAEISRLKAANYDLMSNGGGVGGQQENNDDEGDEGNEPRGVDSLFGRND